MARYQHQQRCIRLPHEIRGSPCFESMIMELVHIEETRENDMLDAEDFLKCAKRVLIPSRRLTYVV